MKFTQAFVILLCVAGHPHAQQPVATLDSLFASIYRNQDPGAMVQIDSADKIIFSKGYGMADLKNKTRINAETNFNIGSVTKQFTAFCILQLADKNKLSLTDHLGKYFPEFNPATGNSITIQELLTHSSGIEDHYGFTDTNLVRHANDKDVLAAVKSRSSTYFEPGTHYRYSNTAYCLLALLVEKLSGMSYGEYVKKYIFKPLQMTHSAVFSMDGPIEKRAMGYSVDSSSKKFTELDAAESIFFSTEGDGGVYTSMEDYQKWLNALDNISVLKRNLVVKAQTPQFCVDTLRQLFYGYGWFISNLIRYKSVYHPGSNGGFRAISFFIPSKKYSVVIFSNRDDVDLELLLQEINRLFNINDKYFIKKENLVSFKRSWPIFAPCKEIPLYSILYEKNLNASVMALN